MIRTAQKALLDGRNPNNCIPAISKAKPGPKPSGNAKIMLTLRLDPDVVAKFRASGAGWQTRMAEALKQAVV